MPSNLLRSVFTTPVQTAWVNLPTAAAGETIIATTPPLVPAFDAAPIMILAVFTATIGTACTAMQLAMRRGGTLAGALVQGATGLAIPVTAGANASFSFLAIDNPGLAQSGVQYALTATATGATGTSAIGTVSALWAIAL